jgi:hypothetical protein
MVWRGPHNGPDPLLWKRAWRTKIRAYRVAQGYLRCARCQRLIDYLGPRYIPGTRRLNPRSLVIGHIHDRASMKRLGYSEQEINDQGNSQPECARCSWTSGAQQGASYQRVQRQVLRSKINSAPSVPSVSSVLTSQTLTSRW